MAPATPESPCSHPPLPPQVILHWSLRRLHARLWRVWVAHLNLSCLSLKRRAWFLSLLSSKRAVRAWRVATVASRRAKRLKRRGELHRFQAAIRLWTQVSHSPRREGTGERERGGARRERGRGGGWGGSEELALQREVAWVALKRQWWLRWRKAARAGRREKSKQGARLSRAREQERVPSPSSPSSLPSPILCPLFAPPLASPPISSPPLSPLLPPFLLLASIPKSSLPCLALPSRPLSSHSSHPIPSHPAPPPSSNLNIPSPDLWQNSLSSILRGFQAFRQAPRLPHHSAPSPPASCRLGLRAFLQASRLSPPEPTLYPQPSSLGGLCGIRQVPLPSSPPSRTSSPLPSFRRGLRAFRQASSETPPRPDSPGARRVGEGVRKVGMRGVKKVWSEWRQHARRELSLMRAAERSLRHLASRHAASAFNR